jgi:hypothetical protein
MSPLLGNTHKDTDMPTSQSVSLEAKTKHHSIQQAEG